MQRREVVCGYNGLKWVGEWSGQQQKQAFRMANISSFQRLATLDHHNNHHHNTQTRLAQQPASTSSKPRLSHPGLTASDSAPWATPCKSLPTLHELTPSLMQWTPATPPGRTSISDLVLSRVLEHYNVSDS